MKHVFVMNPVAGNRIAKKMQTEIVSVCSRMKVDFSLYFTKSADDAARFVRDLLASDKETQYRIYACGGDGTLSDIVNAAYGFDNVEIAVVPIGTGNDFTRNFGSPKDFCDIEDYLDGKAVEIDLIRYNDRVSINVSNMGFDCEVVDMMERNRRKPFMNSSFSYTICVFLTLMRFPKGRIRFITEDGKVRESSFLLSLFANGAYYGGGYKAASKADLQDGMLEWIEVPSSITRMDLIKIISSYKKGKLLDDKKKMEKYKIAYRRVRKILLEAVQPMKICVDGEIVPLTQMTLECLNKAVRFVLPKRLYKRFVGDKTVKATAFA